MTDTIRRTGRPAGQASQALLHHLVDTATKLFIEDGYPATSIERIAAAAGCGKQTIYRHFGSKQDLFLDVMDCKVQDLHARAVLAKTAQADPLDALREVSRLFMEFALHPDARQLLRILIAESARFPQLGDHVVRRCMAPFTTELHALLETAMNTGRLRDMDVFQAGDLLRNLISGGATLQALIDPDHMDSPEKREAYFAVAWNVFLHSMSKG